MAIKHHTLCLAIILLLICVTFANGLKYRLTDSNDELSSTASNSNDTKTCDDPEDLDDADIADRCRCAKEIVEADADDSRLHFGVFHYCHMAPVPGLSALILFGLYTIHYASASLAWLMIVGMIGGVLDSLIFLFYVLANTADRYLVPALNQLSDFFKLSPNVAGVTLLAFGNGAPDVFTSFSSFKDSDGSVGMSAVLGAGVFVTTVVLASVLWAGDSFKTFRRPFIRDLVFYIIAIVVLFILYTQGRIYFPQAILFILWYIAFVLVVVIGRIIFQRYKRNKKERNRPLLENDGLLRAEPTTPVNAHAKPPKELREIEPDLLVDDEATTRDVRQQGDTDAYAGYNRERQHLHLPKLSDTPPHSRPHSRRASHAGLTTPARSTHSHYHQAGDYLAPPVPAAAASSSVAAPANDAADAHSASVTLTLTPPSPAPPLGGLLPGDDNASYMSEGVLERSMKKLEAENAPVWKKMLMALRKLVAIIVFILEAPLTIMRTLSIPSLGSNEEGEEEDPQPFALALSLVFAPLLLCLVFEFDGTATLLVGIFCSAFAWAMLEKLVSYDIDDHKILMPKWMELIFLILAFLLSCVWIYLVAGELVALLEVLGLVFGLSKGLLGQTVLAWGNSIGDLVSNTVLARNGNPRMAAAGCFGAPFFNGMVGLGLGLSYKTITTGSFDFAASKSAPLAFLGLIGSLVITLIIVPISGFTYTRKHAVILCVYYFVFLTYGILLEMDVLPPLPIGNQD